MTKTNFAMLMEGDIIKNIGNGQAWIITSKRIDSHGNFTYIIVRQIEATNASEWEFVTK